MVIKLHNDFRDFLHLLNKQKVKYIVVGGYAVIHHGYNRTTGDLDIWVEQTEDNFNLLCKAFLKFGLPVSAIDKVDFLNNEKDVYTFGRPPVSIEILTRVKGLRFEQAFEHFQKVLFDDLKVNMIDAHDLIKAKKAAGRFKDLDDIENLNAD